MEPVPSMNPTILGAIGPGLLNQVPILLLTVFAIKALKLTKPQP